MKINPLLQKLELSKIKNNLTKIKFHKTIIKGNFVSIIYYDIEKENIKLQQFTGICTHIKSKGYNTKINIKNIFKNITIEQQFFLYSPFVLDLTIIK